jgi:polyhydroxybutyrate depolymerase
MAVKSKAKRLMASVLTVAAVVVGVVVMGAAQVEASEPATPAGPADASSLPAHLHPPSLAVASAGRRFRAASAVAGVASPLHRSLVDDARRPPAGGIAVPADPDDPGGPRGLDRLPLAVREGLQPLLPPPVPGWSIAAFRLRWEGLDRYYLVARPRSGGTSHLPLMVVLHGHGMVPATMESLTHFLQTVGRAVVVYPAGYWASWDAGYCCGVAARQGVDDVGFVGAVVHRVRGTGRSRLRGPAFLVGYSNGGRMAYRLACQEPGAFAGVAAVEAVPVYPCARTRPVSLLVVASTGDPLITVSDALPPKRIDGHLEPTVAEAVAAWRRLDGCRGGAQAGTAGLFSWQRWHCAAGATLELAVRPGGSHAWYQGSGATPSDQRLVWSFLSSLRRGGPTTRRR